jgi:hypothetical protein
MPGPNRKLTAEQIVAIRKEIAANHHSKREVADRYGVSTNYVYSIVRGAVRKNAGGPITTGWRKRDRAGKPHRTPRTNTGYWGVTANGFGNRFDAWVRHNGRQISVGRFLDPVTAAKAYDAKARELGLPRERLNFPDDAE